MRWFLAGLCFAVVVGLAVATTAIKASNVAARLRLAGIERRILGHTVERAGRELIARQGNPAVDLARRWRRWQELRADRGFE